MARSINFKGVIIGVIALFFVLMVAVWVIAARVNPQMVRTSESTPAATPSKMPKATPHTPPKSR